MRKKELLELGYWPSEFLENLVSPVPDINCDITKKLIWNCPIHGNYEQAISSHLNGHRCRLCGYVKSARGVQITNRLNNPFPDWFIKDLEGSPDKEKVLSGEIRSHDKATFICPIHGPYRQMVKHHMNGHIGCSECLSAHRAKFTQDRQRKANPFPDWFIKDLEGSPDKEKVLSGELKVADRALFNCNKHGLYSQLIYSHLAGKGCSTCAGENREYRSNREKSVELFLKSLGFEVKCNYRNLLFGYNSPEIDIYLPEIKVAFEFNGYYFHSLGLRRYGSLRNDIYYHRRKTELALSRGIKLYHIWEDCSDDLCFSLIRVKVGLAERVYARNLKLFEPSNSTVAHFQNLTHVDGYTRYSKAFALYDGREVYCILTLRKTFTGDWDIARFSSRLNTVVVGGYSRLLKHAVSWLKTQGVCKLVSYCNRDLSPDPSNNFYSNHGFNFLSENLIMRYFVYKDTVINGKSYNRRQIVDRFSFRKQVLVNELLLRASLVKD